MGLKGTFPVSIPPEAEVTHFRDEDRTVVIRAVAKKGMPGTEGTYHVAADFSGLSGAPSLADACRGGRITVADRDGRGLRFIARCRTEGTCQMKRRILGLLTLTLPFSTAPLRADEVDHLVNDLKPSPVDYAAWAGNLLKAAEGLEKKPEAQVRLYEKAYELGIKNAKGYPTAIKAARVLWTAGKENRLAWGRKLLAVLKLDWRAAGRKGKEAAAKAYLDHLIAVADDLAVTDDVAEAVPLYTEASYRAKQYAPDRREEVSRKLKDVRQQKALQQRLAQCKRQVAANPKNLLAREQLIRLYAAELDDLAEAAKLLTPDVSEKLRTYVPLAQKGVDQAPKEACLELGDWYKSLAAEATLRGRAKCLARAAGYYQRFLKLEADPVQAVVGKAKLSGLLQVSGTIRAKADDLCWVCVNGNLIAQSPRKCRPCKPAKIALRIGDVICAKLKDVILAGRGFHMHFTGDDGRVLFGSDADWRYYRPADPEKWWVFQPSDDDGKCRFWGSERVSIWGKGNPAYVYRVVAAGDLAPPPWKAGGAANADTPG